MKILVNRFTISVIIICSLTLSSCGFRLRGAVDLPAKMEVVLVEGISAGSPFVRNLKQTLEGAGGRLTAERKSATIVLKVLEDKMKRRVVSLTDTGKANEFELTYTLVYQLLDPNGEIIMPSQTIQIVKDYFNEQINVIGKSQEEDVIRSEIYKEAARALIRRTEVVLKGR